VGIVTELGFGWSQVRISVGASEFSLEHWLWGPPSFLLSGYRVSFSVAKREVKYSPQYISEVKNGWSYASAPRVCLHGVGRESFTLFFYLLPFSL